MKPKKSLGQHFLKDKAVLRKIADIGNIQEVSEVVEIGAGSGALTEEILKRKPARLIALEIDPRWVEFLKRRFGEKVEVLQEDAVNFNFSSLGGHYTYMGNLPYNVATAILRNLLTHRKTVKKGIFMLQKEVATRLTSKRGKNYGYFPALFSHFFRVKPLFDVPPSAFYPPPKVTSTVVELLPTGFDLPENELLSFERFLKVAFSHRRKKLKSNLPPPLPAVGELLDRRAEELPPEELLELYERLKEKGYLCFTT